MHCNSESGQGMVVVGKGLHLLKESRVISHRDMAGRRANL